MYTETGTRSSSMQSPDYSGHLSSAGTASICCAQRPRGMATAVKNPPSSRTTRAQRVPTRYSPSSSSPLKGSPLAAAMAPADSDTSTHEALSWVVAWSRLAEAQGCAIPTGSPTSISQPAGWDTGATATSRAPPPRPATSLPAPARTAATYVRCAATPPKRKGPGKAQSMDGAYPGTYPPPGSVFLHAGALPPTAEAFPLPSAPPGTKRRCAWPSDAPARVSHPGPSRCALDNASTTALPSIATLLAPTPPPLLRTATPPAYFSEPPSAGLGPITADFGPDACFADDPFLTTDQLPSWELPAGLDCAAGGAVAPIDLVRLEAALAAFEDDLEASPLNLAPGAEW